MREGKVKKKKATPNEDRRAHIIATELDDEKGLFEGGSTFKIYQIFHMKLSEVGITLPEEFHGAITFHRSNGEILLADRCDDIVGVLGPATRGAMP